MFNKVRSIKLNFLQGLSASLCGILLLPSFIGLSTTATAQFVLKHPFGSPNSSDLFCEDLTEAPDPNSLHLKTSRSVGSSQYGPYETFYTHLPENELNSNFANDQLEGLNMFDVNRVEGRIVIKIAPEYSLTANFWEKLKFDGIKKLSPIFPLELPEVRVRKMSALRPEKGSPKPDLNRWMEAWLEEGVLIEEIIKKLNAMDEVEYAEPDFLFQLAGDGTTAKTKLNAESKKNDTSGKPTGYGLLGGPAPDLIPNLSTDPGMAKQWHHDVLNIPAAWNYLASQNIPTGGSTNTIIAIIDTGVDINHPDLKNNIWVNRATHGDLLVGKIEIEYDEKDQGESKPRKQQIVDLRFVKNTGNGTMILDQTSESTLSEYWVVTCINSEGTPTVFSVNGSKSDDHIEYLLSDGQYTSDGGEISFLISTGNKNFAYGDQFEFRTWAGEIPGNGIDDDQNGFIDDINGVNVVSDKRFHTVDVKDVNGHGTHIAGAAAAQAGNGVGGVGVAFNAKIMPIRAAQYSGALSSTDISEAIMYAWQKGADVINMSFALPYESMLVKDALTEAFGTSVLVAAAGNYGKPILCCGGKVAAYYPAVYDWVIGVEARSTEPCFCPARPPWLTTFSNYDNAMTGVWPSRRDRFEYEVSVPGLDIYSTWPGEEKYFSLDGTSMACGITSGMAALLKAKWTTEEGFYSRFIMSQIVSSSYIKDNVSLDDIPAQDIPGEAEKAAIPFRDTWGPAIKLDTTGKLVSLLEGYKDMGFYDFPFRKVPDMLGALTKAPTPFISLKEQWIFDMQSISEVNDDDGRIDTGETIEMALVVRNHWGKATDVTIKLHAISKGEKGLLSSDSEGQQSFQDDPYVEMLTGEANIGAIGTYCWKDNGLIYKDGIVTGITNPLKFKVKDNTPNDHIIPFMLSVTCKNGYGPDQGFDVDDTVYKFPEIDKYTMPWKQIIALQNLMRFNLFVQNGEELPKVYSPDNVWSLAGEESPAVANGGSGYKVGDFVTFTGGDLSESLGRTSVRAPAKFTVSQVDASGAVESITIVNNGAYTTAPGSEFQVEYGIIGGSGSGLKMKDVSWAQRTTPTTFKLRSDKYYIIKEQVTVLDNAILSIDPGTKVQWGSPFPMNPLPEATYPLLTTDVNGRVDAVGTVEEPIEFFYSGYSYNGKWRTVTASGNLNLSHVKVMNPDMSSKGTLDHMYFDSDTDDKTGRLAASQVTHSIFDFSNWSTSKPRYKSPPKIGTVKMSLFDRDHSAPRNTTWRKKDWDKTLYIGSIQDSVFLPDVLNSHDWVRPHSSTVTVHDSISDKTIFTSAAKNFFFPVVRNGKTYVGIFTSSDSERNVIEMGEYIANHFVKDGEIGHVASINDQAEHDFLVDYVDKYTHRVAFDEKYGRIEAYNVGTSFYGKAMIGLNDFKEEGKWVWSSGEAVDFTKWQTGIWNASNRNVALINSTRRNDGAKDGYFGTWEYYLKQWGQNQAMMILELPGLYTQEQLDEAEYQILPKIAHKASNQQLKNNALLIPTWDPEVRNLMQFDGPWMSRDAWGSIANNYWGGGSHGISDHVIGAMITDFEEDFNKGKIVFAPKLTTAPENAYPHVVDIKLIRSSGEIKSLSVSSTTATATTTKAHSFITGDTVHITGATGPSAEVFNASHTITKTGNNTFTMTVIAGTAAGTGILEVHKPGGVSLLQNPSVGVETIRFHVSFNRDMDTSTMPFVSFGPDAPITDFQVGLLDGKWVDARTWTGSEYISYGLNNGYQMVGVWGARAADDKWLVTGYDAGRFRFRIDYGTAESLDLQADGSRDSVKLTLSQTDYDLLTGYNIYRSDTKGGDYKRINSFVVRYATGQLTYTDSDISAGRDYYYKFRVVKTGGEESGFSNMAVATTADTIAPNVYHVPIENTIANLPLTVLATVIDNKTVYESNLFFRLKGETEYRSIPMEKIAENQYRANIPGSQVSARGIEYYIEASDGVNKAYANINAQRGGKITVREYHDINSTSLSYLKNSSKFNSPTFDKNGAPDLDTEAYSFEWPAGPDPVNNPKARPKSDFKDRYGWQILGYLLPPETGLYRFFLAADDNSELYLSTDHTPANAVRIAAESSWRGVRDYPNFHSDSNRDESVSKAVSLVAGRRYFIEAIAKESGGGDNLAVAWQMPGENIPKNGAIPISGEYIEPWDPNVGEQAPASKANSVITINVDDKPLIFTIDTLSGTDKGGTKVVINGINFKSDSAVFFGAEKSPNVTYINQNKIEAVSPPMREGHYDVAVINNYSENVSIENIGIRDNLVVHLPMDGNLEELSGRKNDSYQIGNLKFEAGNIGTHHLMADFNGENRITLMDPSDLDFGSNQDFSISMWTKNAWSTNSVPGAVTGYPLISSMDIQGEHTRDTLGQTPGWILGTKPDGELFFELNGRDGSSTLGKKTGINDAAWHHIALTVDRDSSFTLYVDGSPIAEKIINTTMGSIDSGLFTNIGESGYGDYMGVQKFQILSNEHHNDAPSLSTEILAGSQGYSRVYSTTHLKRGMPLVMDNGNLLIMTDDFRSSGRKGSLIGDETIRAQNRQGFNFWHTGTRAVVKDESENTYKFIIKRLSDETSFDHGTTKRVLLNCSEILSRWSVLVLDNGGLLALESVHSPDNNGESYVYLTNWTGATVPMNSTGRTALPFEAGTIKGGEIVKSPVSSGFKGLGVDDLGIWGRSLSSAQINAIYIKGLTGQDLSKSPNVTNVKFADGSHAVAPSGFIFESDLARLEVNSVKAPSDSNRVSVSVTASNLTNLDNASITLEYDASKLVLINPTIGPNLTAWTLEKTNEVAGSVEVSLQSTVSKFNGRGELFSVEFELLRNKLKAGEKLPVKITKSILNAGVVTPVIKNGIIIIEGGFSISGKIVHWNSNREVPGTIVHLTGQDTVDYDTGKSGWINFQDLDSGQYRISPEKNNNVNGISSYDASLIMRHVVGVSTITNEYALKAADVSGNGTLSSLDAFYILDHSVGNRKLPFPGVGKVWAFTPNDSNLTIFNASLLGQDFKAILMGDVSGDWAYNKKPDEGFISSPSEKRIPPDVLIGSNTIRSDAGGGYVTRLFVQAGDNPIYGIDLKLNYYDDNLQFVESESDYSVAVNNEIKNTLQIGIANPHGITGDSLLATLRFSGDGNMMPTVSYAVINENQFSVGRKKDLTGFDTDEDGLLDVDEQEILGTNLHVKDSDGDGVTDFNEFRTYSDPLDKESFLRLQISYNDGVGSLIINSPKNSKIHVEYTESLDSGQWINQEIGDHSWGGETTIPLEEITDDIQRYYRLRIEQ